MDNCEKDCKKLKRKFNLLKERLEILEFIAKYKLLANDPDSIKEIDLVRIHWGENFCNFLIKKINKLKDNEKTRIKEEEFKFQMYVAEETKLKTKNTVLQILSNIKNKWSIDFINKKIPFFNPGHKSKNFIVSDIKKDFFEYEKYFKSQNKFKTYNDLNKGIKEMIFERLEKNSKEFLQERWNHLETVEPNSKTLNNDLIEFRKQALLHLKKILANISSKLEVSFEKQIILEKTKEMHNPLFWDQETKEGTWLFQILKNGEIINNFSKIQEFAKNYSVFLNSFNFEDIYDKIIFAINKKLIEEGQEDNHQIDQFLGWFNRYISLVKESKKSKLKKEYQKIFMNKKSTLEDFNSNEYANIVKNFIFKIVNDLEENIRLQS